MDSIVFHILLKQQQDGLKVSHTKGALSGNATNLRDAWQIMG
jgi:hypothetical protein